ncbi:MAG: chalcone isomerase family protein, partial [Planctomycetaceae bacterium]
LAVALIVIAVNLPEEPDPEIGADSLPKPALTAETLQVAGAAFPKLLALGDGTLQLIGVGVRTQFRLEMYAMALYCATGAQSDRNIIEFDLPAAIRLEIVSNLVSKERFERAVIRGFRNSTFGKPNQLQAELAELLPAFADPLKKKDVFDFVYQPGIGTRVVKNGEVKATVQGAEFKQALFGIWIGEAPIDEALKNQLLASVNAARPSESRKELVPVDAQQSQTAE